MVGNGTSPTSAATTASLSGTSQTSLNSSGSSSRLRSNVDQKKSAATELVEKLAEDKDTKNNSVAPIATMNDDEFKLDGGEATKVMKNE